jgi:hypothetical protein
MVCVHAQPTRKSPHQWVRDFSTGLLVAFRSTSVVPEMMVSVFHALLESASGSEGGTYPPCQRIQHDPWKVFSLRDPLYFFDDSYDKIETILMIVS